MICSTLLLALGLQSPVPPIEPARLRATIGELAAFPTRHTLSPHNAEAGAWIEDRFKALGYEVERHAFDYRGQRPFNVVATRRGSESPDEFIVIGAHYDSRTTRLSNAEAPAPGADDNASGVAAILEVARALKDVPTEGSIRFIAYSGEEQGLIGATAYAKMAQEKAMNIAVVINLDMVGRPDDPDGLRIFAEHDPGLRVRDNDAPSRAWADRLFRAAERAGLKPEEGPIYGSDYIPFEAAGYACIGLYDGADDQPFYHSGTDTPDGVDVDYTAKAASAVLRLLLDPE